MILLLKVQSEHGKSRMKLTGKQIIGIFAPLSVVFRLFLRLMDRNKKKGQ